MLHEPKSSGFRKEKRLDTDTAGRSGGDGSRERSDAAGSQGTPWMASSHQELGERQGLDSPSEHPGGTNIADTWISDFWPPELGENKFLLF